MQLDRDYLPGAFYIDFASREDWERAIERRRSVLVRKQPRQQMGRVRSGLGWTGATRLAPSM